MAGCLTFRQKHLAIVESRVAGDRWVVGPEDLAADFDTEFSRLSRKSKPGQGRYPLIGRCSERGIAV